MVKVGRHILMKQHVFIVDHVVLSLEKETCFLEGPCIDRYIFLFFEFRVASGKIWTMEYEYPLEELVLPTPGFNRV